MKIRRVHEVRLGCITRRHAKQVSQILEDHQSLGRVGRPLMQVEQLVPVSQNDVVRVFAFHNE